MSSVPPRAALPWEKSLLDRYETLDGAGFETRPADGLLRGLDIAIAAAALAALSPAIGVIAALVRLSSGPPVFYRGTRVGHAGKPFVMLKFRTLHPDAETRLGAYSCRALVQLTAAEYTPVGRVLRATYLDELPQFINVLRGEMSIVGPRPIRPAFFDTLVEDIPQYWQRLVVRPGMTGLAQLRMTKDMSWAEKLSHDLEYIADRSPRLYVTIIAQTGARIIARPPAAVWRRLRRRR